MEKIKLLLTVVNKGFAGDVVAAAREAGAKGATVLSGEGVGTSDKTFMGISLAPEKEVVLILLKEEIVLKVQNAISAVVGLKSPASGISFCVPVDAVTNIKGLISPN